MDSLIGMLINRFAELTASALALVLATLLFRSYKSVIGVLKNKIKSTNNKVLQEALSILQRMVDICVQQAEQTIVKDGKNGNGNKLSPESIAKIKDFVIDNVKANMPNNIMELLEKYGVDLDGIIISFIENAVLESKNQINKTKDSKETVT